MNKTRRGIIVAVTLLMVLSTFAFVSQADSGSAFVPANVDLYWHGMEFNNYIINSTPENATLVVPQKNVYFNVSNAYYPDYKDVVFAWYLNGVKLNETSYNISINFSNMAGKNIVNVSANGANTTFIVYVIPSNIRPSLSYKVYQNSHEISLSNGKYYVKQNEPVNINASGHLKYDNINVPVFYKWYVNSTLKISQYLNYTFKNAFKNYTVYLNGTSETGNYKNISITFYVNDTTAPRTIFNIYYQNGTKTNLLPYDEYIILSGNKSYDRYFGHDLRYRWSFLYKSNGTVLPSSLYNIKSGNLTSQYLIVKFMTLSPLNISLKTTNPLNLSSYYNESYTPYVSEPYLVVQSIYIPRELAEGVTGTIYVNVTNRGSSTASSFTLEAVLDGKTYYHFYSLSIAPGAYANVSFKIKPPQAGSPLIQFKALNKNEPAGLESLGALTTRIHVKTDPYYIYIATGAVVLALFVIGIVLYEIDRRSRVELPARSDKNVNKSPTRGVTRSSKQRR
ncbi:CARDB domain-containing protein [Picrophilus oshimae]|uniref:Hypothetical exported protein n=1 Tax=Picrophilus torridus (strain ATCC 700027 / DSM 9790 / JCM 10055 / NBRC 100828 / KAW 2/3) TaxID=1122961 RepID=Q6L1G3_PICTO|nr:CARDB domain-containing protein [Picrophilus oshimae]AAT43189.1 hypothetical exported protein [Picrophilus oshimae DSM 9789]